MEIVKGIELGMVSGTCFHGKCVFLRVEHKLARAHVRMDDLGTFLAPFWHLQSTLCCGADLARPHSVKHGYRRCRLGGSALA